MSQSIQPEKFVEIQSMAKAYVAELEGDENNVHVLPTMRDAAYNAYCDAYHDGFIAGASSLLGEVERLREENERLKREIQRIDDVAKCAACKKVTNQFDLKTYRGYCPECYHNLNSF